MGAGRSGFGATTTPSPASASRASTWSSVEVAVLDEDAAGLQVADLLGPGERLVEHAVEGGPGTCGPEVGGSVA